MQGRTRSYSVIIACIAAVAGILFGYDTGVVSGAILFINHAYALSPKVNSIVVSSVLLGALVGAICSGKLTDIFGRKKLLIADALIFIFGTLLTAISGPIYLIILGRVIVGIAIGVASYVAPLYISEVAPTEQRGALVSLNQLAVTLGILLSYCVDYYFSASQSWRWMFAFGIFPAAIFLIGLCFLPESPRWLLTKQDKQKKQRENWRILLTKPFSKTLVIGVGLAIIQQITGINTIIYYAPTIFTMAGFHSAQAAILATLGVGIIFVLFTLIAIPLIDAVGRRPLLLIGLSGMAFSLLLLSLAFHCSESTLIKYLSFASMMIYIACFAFSLGPIVWLMIAEIYPLSVRGIGASIATAANWGSNMIVALTFLSMIQSFGTSQTFFLYFCVSAASLLFVYFLVPETKNISLEQFEMNLFSGYSYRQLVKQGG